MVDRWRGLARDLLGLVLPISCAGCGADDDGWCPTCATALAGPARRVEQQAGRLDRMDGDPPVPVWAVADFAGPVRRAVSVWKDRGRTDLTGVLAAAARRAARAVADERVWSGSPVLVVPAPSTPAARRARGWDPAAALAAAVADELNRRGAPARVATVLRRAPGRDQSGLSARARSRNLAGQVRVRRWPATPPGRAVLVDDVLTTGATFAACVHALDAAGVGVVAGVVVAATPHPGLALAPLDHPGEAR